MHVEDLEGKHDINVWLSLEREKCIKCDIHTHTHPKNKNARNTELSRYAQD